MTDFSKDETVKECICVTTEKNGNKLWCRLLKYAVFAFFTVMTVYSLIIYAYASRNTVFAERYCVTVSALLRKGLAFLTGFLPFSLAETVVVAIIPLVILLLVRVLVLRFYYKEKGHIRSFILKLLCVLMAAVALFINTFGICYKRERLSNMLGIDTGNINDDDLMVTAYLCIAAASGYLDEISHLPDGSTVMPYGFDEMTKRIHNGYKVILKNVPEVMSVKPVALSEPWTYTYISGMYFPFTGESNVNVNYPDFVVAFTAAHEMAHQLGFASEDEANMMAFLALHYSDDSYLIYSAYMNALDYLIADMKSQSAAVLGGIADHRILKEFISYSQFLRRYSNKTASVISDSVNDAYLKANGVENGSRSYNDVTELICGFMKEIYGSYYEIYGIDVND